MITLSSKTIFVVENTDTKQLEKIYLVVRGEDLDSIKASFNLDGDITLTFDAEGKDTNSKASSAYTFDSLYKIFLTLP